MIVGIGEVSLDEKLAIVKGFRECNKRLGILKRELQAATQGITPQTVDPTYLETTIKPIVLKVQEEMVLLTELTTNAQEANFQIWVNMNGKTGHTYEKDYRETPDEDNDPRNIGVICAHAHGIGLN